MPLTRSARRANDVKEMKMVRNNKNNNNDEATEEKRSIPDEIVVPDFSKFAHQEEETITSNSKLTTSGKSIHKRVISTNKDKDKNITRSSKAKKKQKKKAKGDDDMSITVSTPPASIKKMEHPPIPSVLSKKRRKSPKKIKIEPGSLKPPKNWEKIYLLVKEFRSDRTAPVDFDGPLALAERTYPRVFRFQVLIALMLSSQTKDAVVGESIRALQKHGLNADNINETSHEVLNGLIRKVGFHNNKTKYIKETAYILLREYDGDIPRTADEMVKALPGVGPKMAYIVETLAWNQTSGIGIDTHLHRMFNQLKWVNAKYPEETRIQMEGWLPREKWGEINYLFVGFGQEIQQQKEKTLVKAIGSDFKIESLGLLQKLGFDVKKEAKKYDFELEVRNIMKYGP